MPTRNVNLTSHLSDFVDAQISGGRYQNASEVIRDSLRLLEERERAAEAKLQAWRAAIQVGVDQLDRGEAIQVDDLGAFFAAIEAEVGVR